jgi:hypothetical protein
MTTKPTVPDLKELFKQASEIASQVPESMQEAAFNRALDMLTLGSTEKTHPASSSSKEKLLPVKSSTKARNSTTGTETIEELLTNIDSTQHPGIAAAPLILDRALMTLQIARIEHGVDGLTPTQIAKILTEKFRLSTSNAAVSMALGKATNLVNRISEGQGYKYRIMNPGEEYLAHLSSDKEPLTRLPRSNAKKSATKKKATPTKSFTTVSKPNKKSGTRPGPKQFLERLIADGFFSSPREISSIISHIQQAHAHTYKASDMAPTLVRLLRENKLKREKNKDGRYEYFT